MAHDENVKNAVRRHFVFDFLTLEQAAEKAGVPYNTARRWKKDAEKKGDNWDRVRDAGTMASGKADDVARGMLTAFVIYFEQLMNELQASEDLPLSSKAETIQGLADSYAKMVASSKRLLPEVSQLGAALQTVELLGEYIQAHKPQLLSEFTDLLPGFAETLDKAFK